MSDNSEGADALDAPETDTYRTDYDPERERPSVVLVRAVAAITGRRPDDVLPLDEAVPPESLDDLFRPTERGGLRSDGRVEFEYHGFRVTVSGDGSIEIRSD